MKENQTPAWIAWLENCLLVLFVVCLCMAQWIPCDSVSVAQGSAIPQHAMWLIVFLGYSSIRLLARDSNPFHTWNGKWNLFFLIAIAWLALDTFLIQGRGNVRLGINVFWQWIITLAVFWVTPGIAKSRTVRQGIVTLLVGLSLSVVIHGVYQYAWSMPQLRAQYAKDPESVLRQNGNDSAPGSASRILFESRLQSTEPLGPYALTNTLAGSLLVGLVLVMGRLRWSHHRLGRIQFFMAALCSLLFLLVLFLTKSRTAWLAGLICLGAGTVTHPVLREKWRGYGKWLVAMGLLAIGLLIGIVAIYDPLILWEAPKSLAFRWQYWRSTLQMILDHPILGVGVGNFQNYYAQYRAIDASETIADPHSFLMETASLLGLPGLVLLIVFAAMLAQPLWRILFTSSSACTLVASGSSSDKDSESARQFDIPNSSWFNTTTKRTHMMMSQGVGIAALMVWLIPDLFGPSPEEEPYRFAVPWMILWIWSQGREAVTFRCSVLAILGMTIHLLASGGWMTPGCTTGIACLAGVLVSETGKPIAEPTSPKRISKDSFSWLALAFPVLLSLTACLAFLTLSWNPTFAIANWRREIPRSYESAVQMAQEAMKGDPWDPSPVRGLAIYHSQELLRLSRNPGRKLEPLEKELSIAIDEWQRRDPHSFGSKMEAGQLRLGMGALSQEHVLEAARLYRQATSLNPNDAWSQLQFAVAAHLAGDREGARRGLAKALEIDEKTPHADRKLKAGSVYWPNIPGKPKPPDGNIDQFAAEPAAARLRTILESPP